MNFDGRAFLGTARELAIAAPAGTPLDLEAANLRSSISRAYYAAFWQARAQLRREGEQLPRMDAHQFVIEAFRTSRYRARMSIGLYLFRLRAERNNADYQANIGGIAELRTKANRALESATLVMTQIDALDQ
jgi:uncharacterized protein (UPF0332 family)